MTVCRSSRGGDVALTPREVHLFDQIEAEMRRGRGPTQKHHHWFRIARALAQLMAEADVATVLGFCPPRAARDGEPRPRRHDP